MKKLLIFGSTGSIGTNALDIVRKDKKHFKVQGLCAYQNIGLLIKQIKEFKPKYICVVNEAAAAKLPRLKGIKLFKGSQGLREFACIRADISVMGIVGIASLEVLLTAMRHSKRIALASKESLVVGGFLVKQAARRYKCELVPVDSEINALFQLLERFGRKDVHRLLLTASGGSLWGMQRKKWKSLTAEEVLRHPTWRMGRRITVDSATLVNKGFEAVETHYLFDVPYKNIDILIHRKSLIHALVELKDGISFLCMHKPDMRMPLSHSLYYPQRHETTNGSLCVGRSDIDLQPINYRNYPLLETVLQAAQKKRSHLACVNAADEVAIDYFLEGKIAFTDLIKTVEHVASGHTGSDCKNLKEVLFWDNWARIKAKEYLTRAKTYGLQRS